MRLAVSLAASIAFAVAACGDDTTANDGDDTGGTTGTSEGESSTTTSAADDAVDSSGVAPTSASEGAAPPALEYARGIRLSRLIANQAVQVELVVDGVTVDPATHTSRLVSGRRTLVRAFWSLHAGFEPRELVGRLIVGYPDGSELVDDRVEMVDGESIDKGPSFQWLLDPDDVQAGMTLRVQALEPDVAAASGEVSDPPPILPYESALALPVHEAVLEMKVVLIPVLHQLDGCEQVPVPTEEDVAAIAAQLEQNNALQSAMVTVGEPMPYTDPIGGQDNGFSPVLTALAMQRETDAPDPNVYYYGLLMPCDGFPPGLLGQAIGIPPSPTKELAYQRVSTGRWQGTGAATAETLVHEVGHTQGRRHVLCSGGEGGPDPSYPHENGRIGVWGFGIHDFQLRAPTSARDYMTYCANEWVSDYGWEQTLDVIETLTSWDFEDGGESSRDGVLVGAIHADGSSTWWTARGAPPATSSDARVVWTIEGLEVVRAAHAEPMPDGTA
ncbi:MAG TPA: hypothetical protein VFG69_14160, partial [Nannocystaceae bacterium]|nr:hypothetical protein [Nannocystaceae bacterium]